MSAVESHISVCECRGVCVHLSVTEVFVRRFHENEALWYTFGGGTKLTITGPAVKPSVSLLPPSSLQISGDSAALLCLLSSYSPQGAQVSWRLDGSEVTEGVQTSAESERDGRYSRSSVLSLSKARWEAGERFVCRVTHDGAAQETSFLKSSEC
uniref:Ig-like domain-containing protein n=1 Tax=Cyprinus carpio TaxID=7962 RepID=A0A8C1GW75_CYPCA